MAKDRVAELVEKRQQLLDQVEQVNSELGEALGFTGKAVAAKTAPAAAPKKGPTKQTTPRKTKPAAAAADGENGENGESRRQPSLKDVVQDILSEGGRGMELKEIVGKFTFDKDSKEWVCVVPTGEYRSKAKKITPVVSQALFQLKQEKLISVEKSSDNNRNLYSLSNAA